MIPGEPWKNGIPEIILNNALVDRQQIDNVILLSGSVEDNSKQQEFVSFFLKKFRQLVNPNLLYANISFSGKGCGFSESIKPEHDNDIYITGFSDAILRFIAERGEGGQLLHVENIDDFFKLKPLPITMESSKPARTVQVERPLPIPSNTPSWRTFKVFISSTFRDMHGERDILTRYVFPELRALGKKHFINIYEVDLRWGVTEEETKSNKTLELCLSEVSKCQYFIGILGERYGYVPETYNVPDTPEYDWVRNYPTGSSVTELEMHLGVLMNPIQKQDKSIMMIRNNAFIKNVPKEFLSDFAAENPQVEAKMTALKNRVRNSSLELIDGYDCHWGGVVDGKPIVSGLEKFAMPVINSVWNSVRKQCPDEDAMLDETLHATKQHEAMVNNHRSKFVGRKNLTKECLKHMKELATGGILSLIGKAGTGKSAVLASLVTSYKGSHLCDSPGNLLVHIVGAAPGSTNIMATLRRLCHEIKRQFGLTSEVPEDYKNITQKFSEMLCEASKFSGSPIVVFMDGLDMMENTLLPSTMDWLPNPVPKNVIFVVSALEDGKFHKSLKRLGATEVSVGPLDMWDKADVVRNNLAVHRKALDESPFNNQMKLLLSKREGANPLYLKLACEELRVFGVFERISTKLKSLPHTTPALLQDVLSRLESDIGQELVSMAISLLVCSRSGLEVEELHDLLSLQSIMGNDRFKMDDVRNVQLSPDQMLPAAIFGHLRRSLETFLNPTDSWNSRLTLAHKDIDAAVRQRYMKGSSVESTYHKLLAGYFFQQADPDKDYTFKGNNPRAFTELPYHLVYCSEFKELKMLLCSLNFIHSKCQLGLAIQLMDDYQDKELFSKMAEKEQNKMMNLEEVKQFKLFVSRQIHVLSGYPALTWQQARNEPDSSPVYSAVQNEHLTSGYMSWNNKSNDADPCYQTLSNLPQPVSCVAISMDSRYFACGGMDCLVKLYDFNTGKELHTFRGHANAITSICFVGQSLLCSAGLDNSISVWHLEQGHRVHVLTGHNRRVQSCASDKAGKVIASASWDCTVKIWNATKGDRQCELLVGSPVNCVDFHPDGQLIVTGSWDATLKIWDIFHRQRKAILRGHQTSVRDVAYSPSGRHIASASLDGDVKLWSAFNGTQVGNIQGHSLPINKLTFSPSGKELITVSDDHKVKVWSGNLGKPVQCIANEYGAAMSVSLKSDVVFVGYHSGDIRCFDTMTGWEIFSQKHHTASVRCIRYIGGGLVVAGSDDNTVSVMSESNGKLLARMGNHNKPILCLAHTTEYLAVGSEDFTCSLHKNSTEKDFTSSKKNPGTLYQTLHGHIGPVTSCTFSGCGKQLATASRDASIRIYLVDSVNKGLEATLVKVLNDCHKDWITGCQWSNIADYIVTSSVDFNLKVWDVSTGSEKQTMTGHMAGINAMTYSYGCVVSCSSDGLVKVWSQKGTEITTLYGHTQRVTGCDMIVSVRNEIPVQEEEADTSWADAVDAADVTGKSKSKKRNPGVRMENVLVATCSDDGSVRIWQPLQAHELANMTGHDDRVLSVASDAHGKLCTSSLDKSVRLWAPHLSTKTAETGHNGPVTFVQCIQSGLGLLTGSRDGVLMFWSLDTSGLVCERSIQVSKKSVNSALYQSTRNSCTVITGGDDGEITSWNVTKTGMKIKRIAKVKTILKKEAPVTCLLQALASSDHIFSADWNGYVTLITVSTGKTASRGILPKPDWILNLYQEESKPKQLFALSCSGSVVILNVTLDKKCSLNVIDTITIPNTVDVDVPLHKKPAVWIHGMALYNGLKVIGDSKGQVTYGTNALETVRVHNGAVTVVTIIEGMIFTASSDRTIKVWDMDFKQLGMFFCPAPVTSLTVITTLRNPYLIISLACGDELGNVHYLTWNSASF